MRRRQLIRGMGLMALQAALAGCAGLPGTGVTPVPDAAADRDHGWIWREALAFARWTPSVHNIQPWRIHVQSPLSAELYCDPDSLLRITDASSAFTLVGFAIFVEYLAVALRPCGYVLKAQFEGRKLDPSSGRPQRVARLQLEPGDREPDTDRQLIQARRTSRLPYDGTKVGEADLQALAHLANRHGQRMIWSSDDDFVRRVLELNRDTLFDDLGDGATRSELRSWIRFTDEEARESRTGLSSRCLGFPGGVLKSFFDRHERWARGWRRRLCADMLMSSMHGTRTVVWWSGPFTTPEDWIVCGTLLARTWLEVTRLGLVLHPFGSVITNASAHARFREHAGPGGDAGHIWMLIRLGRSAPAPRSYRLGGDGLLVASGASGGRS